MARLKQKGVRIVKHLGARGCPADDSVVLAAIPILRGETLRGLHLDWRNFLGAATVTAEELNLHAVFVPWTLVGSQDSITGAILDSLLERSVADDDIADLHYGGEPNTLVTPFGREDFVDMQDVVGVESIYRSEGLMTPDTALGIGVLSIYNRNVRIRKNYFFPESGMILCGVVRYEHSAQTSFGVAEADGSANLRHWAGALRGPLDEEGDDQRDKLRELLYGGDNYIEADKFGGNAVQSVLKLQAVIGTPFPTK